LLAVFKRLLIHSGTDQIGIGPNTRLHTPHLFMC